MVFAVGCLANTDYDFQCAFLHLECQFGEATLTETENRLQRGQIHALQQKKRREILRFIFLSHCCPSHYNREAESTARRVVASCERQEDLRALKLYYLGYAVD